MNMVARQGESWRPPLLPPPNTLSTRLLAKLRRFLDIQNGSIWRDLAGELPHVQGTVLDIGCGAQPYRCLLRPDVRYIGIDTADAKAHFGYEIPDTLYFTGDRWPVDDGNADVVLATETLEHIPDPANFLLEAFRVLRPGGRAILTVPFSARWHFIPHDYWRFTPASLKQVLESAGFMDIAVYARGNEVTVACYKVNALILPLLLPQNAKLLKGILMRLSGMLLMPLLLLLAFIANLSLRGKGGDDCLGYTIIALKPSGPK